MRVWRATPRLSIDWGEDFVKPVLTPYEAEVALGHAPPWWESTEAGGLRTVNEATNPLNPPTVSLIKLTLN
jgi:diphthamide synthase subunit DPH2